MSSIANSNVDIEKTFSREQIRARVGFKVFREKHIHGVNGFNFTMPIKTLIRQSKIDKVQKILFWHKRNPRTTNFILLKNEL